MRVKLQEVTVLPNVNKQIYEYEQQKKGKMDLNMLNENKYYE